MKELRKALYLSQVHTNHCTMATAITLWSDSGMPNRHIMRLFHHRSSTCAAMFSHLPLNPKATQADEQMQVYQGFF